MIVIINKDNDNIHSHKSSHLRIANLIFPLCREIWFSEAACSFHLPGRPGLDGDGYDNDFDDAGDDGDDVYKMMMIATMMICDVSPTWTLRFK